MNKKLLTLILTSIILSSCSIIRERNTERLYKEASEDDYILNFTEEEAEIQKKTNYCNASTMAQFFYVTDDDTYYSLANKILYYKMSAPEKYDEIVTAKNNCYKTYNITDEDIEKVNKKLTARIEYLKNGK